LSRSNRKKSGDEQPTRDYDAHEAELKRLANVDALVLAAGSASRATWAKLHLLGVREHTFAIKTYGKTWAGMCVFYREWPDFDWCMLTAMLAQPKTYFGDDPGFGPLDVDTLVRIQNAGEGASLMAEYHGREQLEAARARGIAIEIERLSIVDRPPNEYLDAVAELGAKIRDDAAAAARGPAQGALAASCEANAELNRETPNRTLRTHPDVDRVLGGLQPGDLCVVAGSTGMGKSAFAVQVYVEAALIGKRCVYFSMEMKRYPIMCRTAGVIGKLNVKRLIDRVASDDEKVAALGCWDQLSTCDHDIRSGKFSIADIEAACAALHAQRPLDLVVIDHIGLLTQTDGRISREQHIAEVANRSKQLAMHHNCAVLALCQINREGSKRAGAPTINDLKDSSAVEQAADSVLIVYRPVQQNSSAAPQDAWCGIKKSRNGATGDVQMRYDGPAMRFKLPEEP
jgi:replicative DNA helicase